MGGRLPNKISHSPEQFAKANGIELCYDTFGDRNALPLLLIMGLGAHMILWDDGFCSALAERGFSLFASTIAISVIHEDQRGGAASAEAPGKCTDGEAHRGALQSA